MDVNLIRIAVTVLSFASFVGIWRWAWKASNREVFDQWSRVCVGLDEVSTDVNEVRRADAGVTARQEREHG